MDNTQAEKLGLKVVELLKLKKKRETKDRYTTSWGNKTLEGIGNCIFRLVKENEDNIA